MDILFAPLYFLLAHTFLGTGIVLLLGHLLIQFLTKRQGTIPAVARNYGYILLILLAFLKLFLGHSAAVRLVHALGQNAQGIVLDTYSTSTMYNNQQVHGHHVLLTLADGRTVQEGFRTDSFNVYPPHNSTAYPPEGEHFDARYLPHFPSAFIILAEGTGSFAHDLRCKGLGQAVDAAERKRGFAPDNPNFRAEAITTLQTYLDAHCEANPDVRQYDLDQLQRLKQ